MLRFFIDLKDNTYILTSTSSL